MQKIYKREEWAAKAPCEPIDKMASPQNISIIYHTATPWECVNFVRFHAKITAKTINFYCRLTA